MWCIVLDVIQTGTLNYTILFGNRSVPLVEFPCEKSFFDRRNPFGKPRVRQQKGTRVSNVDTGKKNHPINGSCTWLHRSLRAETVRLRVFARETVTLLWNAATRTHHDARGIHGTGAKEIFCRTGLGYTRGIATILTLREDGSFKHRFRVVFKK